MEVLFFDLKLILNFFYESMLIFKPVNQENVRSTPIIEAII